MSSETFKAPELDELGKLLPTYEFESFIAQGGMGAVYKARQRSLDRDVAIKILPQELGANQEFRESFQTEAKAMAKLNHPNLIGVYDFGDVNGMPYIVMEFVNGKSLYHSAWNKQIEPQQAVSIVTQICEGLGHAHDNGLIHRDIKPANILLTPKAEPKIGDFGLAQPTDSEGPGLVMGTPGYTAPEAFSNPDAIDKRSDVFGVGAILHELLTGQRPDPKGEKPRTPTGDRALDLIWKTSTSVIPNARYADANAMANALKAWKPASSAPKLVTAAPVAGKPVPGKRPAPAKTVVPGKGQKNKKAEAAEGEEGATPEVQVSTGSSWGLVRNLIIIAVLLVAIAFTWKLLQKTTAEREAENARIERERVEKEQLAKTQREQERKEAEEKARRERLMAEVDPEPEPDPVVEETPPMESLDELRYELAKGERDTMPTGTKRHGEHDYFFVPDEMTWHEASAFAEEHGGYLGLVHSENDLTFLGEFVPGGSSIWIGAGRYGKKRDWVMTDGTDWPLPEIPAGVGQYAALDELGLLRARKNTDTFAFVIQWNRDGSNPASLEAILSRTRRTLEEPNPVYPPGTFAIGSRRFAVIPRDISRKDAERLAKLAGGMLATAATRDEADDLTRKSKGFSAPDGLWLGGRANADGWEWDSGETWDHESWSKGRPKDRSLGALMLTPGRGWSGGDLQAEASGFVIEWSEEVGANKVQANELKEVPSDIVELQATAVRLIKETRKERDDKLKDNVDALEWDLKVWLRGLNKSDTTRWTPQVEGLKELVVDNRVPSPDEMVNSRVKLSGQMAKICEFCYKKQKEIDADYQSMITKIRDHYKTRLKDAANKAAGRGDRDLSRTLNAKLSQIGDPEDWATSMAGE